MAQLSQERIDEFKRIAKETTGKELTDQEALEQGTTLINFFKILIDGHQEELGWKRRLEKEPKGFPMKDFGRSCCVCRVGTSPDNSWYDKYGIKCLDCQRALNKKIIPVSITKDWDHKTWFSKYDLERYLGIKTPAIKKLIREGKLKAREIENSSGGTYFYVFLNKENPEWIKKS
jgi:hypothetical protein